MKIAMLISGGGTTASAILKACRDGSLKNVEPVLVIASSSDVVGIKKAIDAGMKTEDVVAIDPKDFASPEEFGKKIIEECEKHNVEVVDQCGWLRLTPANVVAQFQGRMINQHPGPLDHGRPDFGGKGMFGMRVHAARLEFVKKTNHDFWSEATIQRVSANFDEGPVLNAKRVDILPGDTPENLQQRMLPIEHELQIKTLKDFANGNVKEIIRDIPLVKPEEYKILEECKNLGIEKYPKG